MYNILLIMFFLNVILCKHTFPQEVGEDSPELPAGERQFEVDNPHAVI